MEYPTRDLYFLGVLTTSGYARKIQLTNEKFHRILREALHKFFGPCQRKKPIQSVNCAKGRFAAILTNIQGLSSIVMGY